MTKLAPRVRFTLREKSARSTRERYVQFKTYFLQEEGLSFSRDSIFQGNDTIIVDNFGTRAENRTLNQLKLVWEDFRALYPYRAELKVEQGKSFVRAAFTGNYFFNYAKRWWTTCKIFLQVNCFTWVNKRWLKQFGNRSLSPQHDQCQRSGRLYIQRLFYW
ncbi:MAG: hypothetical protein NVV59_11805 [Chitinophagaceae bacterium]|nr:hypothetical protein [Chitinophagaceae bacterium]